MQIDFHYSTTYVIARYAGFEHKQAEIIAYCSQYVDDATNSGSITFDNAAMYSHISSAHKNLSYDNFDELSNHSVWLPFHFLPGNGLKAAGKSPKGGFIEKIICQPDSPVAKDMVRDCITSQNKPYHLHRLGITLHIYADTWAHQGFAGVTHKVNAIQALDEYGKEDDTFLKKLKHFFKDTFDQEKGKLIGLALPLGHGAALGLPDKPFLKWSYLDHHSNLVKRDNTKIFLDAADKMCCVMQRYLLCDPDAKVSGLQRRGRDKIEELFLSLNDSDELVRHQQWMEKIARGFFHFPGVELDYRAKGENSWKYKALGTIAFEDRKSDIFPYSPYFLESDWKMFHDALLAHRFFIINELLPKYGICAA